MTTGTQKASEILVQPIQQSFAEIVYQQATCKKSKFVGRPTALNSPVSAAQEVGQLLPSPFCIGFPFRSAYPKKALALKNASYRYRSWFEFN